MNPLIVMIVGLLFAGLAWSQTTAIKPLDLSNLYSYLMIALMGVVGGVVSFYQKVKAGQARWINLNELIGELGVSAFTGFVVGLGCQAMDFGASLTFALVGIAGHMGSRGLFLIEKLGQQWLEKKAGLAAVDDPDKTAPGIK